MKNVSSVVLSKSDYESLHSLIRNLDGVTAELLEDELTRAQVVATADLPEDVVAMNSLVEFVDQDTGLGTKVTLVYPSEAKMGEGKVSILAPIGAALIGLRIGQSISWPLPNGKERTLKVLSVRQKISVNSKSA